MTKYRFTIDVSAKGNRKWEDIRREIELAIRATQRKPDEELSSWKPIPLKLESITEAPMATTIGVQSGEQFYPGEKSVQEKDMLLFISRNYPKMREKLKFKLKLIDSRGDAEYQIPAEELGKTLKMISPFDMDFSPDREYLDIHSAKIVKAKDLKIIRSHEINIIVSPFYAESGGTLVDLIDPDRMDENSEILQARTISSR